MLRKCAVCDDKGEKTIDTKDNRYIKSNSVYYHFDCYKLKLTTNKIKKYRMSQEDALLECLRLEEITKFETVEIETKAQLFDIISAYYNVPIDGSFFIKVDTLTKGKYKGISNTITYAELVEMYSNQKMLEKLDKLGYDKNIVRAERMHWDLAVMINEYPRYVKAKLKNKALEQSTQETMEQIKKYKTTDKSTLYRDRVEQTIQENESTTRVDDLVNDIFDFD
jgi:hypothetical protein